MINKNEVRRMWKETAAIFLSTSPLYTGPESLNVIVFGPQSRFGHLGDKKNVLPVPRMEP